MEKRAKYFIYLLTDPRNPVGFYVGKTECGVKRPKEHWRDWALAKDRNKHKKYTILGILEAGLVPGIEILEVFDSHEKLPEAEMEWIAAFRAAGVRLTNMTDGGEGTHGKVINDETRHRLGNGMRGKKHSPETIKLLSGANASCFGRIGDKHPMFGKPSVNRDKRKFKTQFGEIFESRPDAARKLGVSCNKICLVLSGKRKHTRGYIFSYIEEARNGE